MCDSYELNKNPANTPSVTENSLKGNTAHALKESQNRVGFLLMDFNADFTYPLGNIRTQVKCKDFEQ